MSFPLGWMFAYFGLMRIAMSIGILLALFLLFRSILLWYWKISRIEDLLSQILVELRKQPRA